MNIEKATITVDTTEAMKYVDYMEKRFNKGEQISPAVVADRVRELLVVKVESNDN